ncbi:MAG TPA: protein-L-isoaspartate(D-aspartate) O-methyltransferase [Gammaproteobacteria bacterium]
MSRHHLGIGMTSQRTRERMVQRLGAQGISDVRVLDMMRQVPRHIFVDEALASRAYEDTALPIGSGQTISQPYTVARMTSVVVEHSPNRVLEVGTGCGYQAAVLAPLVRELYTIERISALYQKARKRLGELKIYNVKLRHGDGYQGWAAMGPFDAIIVTAAPNEVPEMLLGQLAEGGRMILPVGRAGQQQLTVLTRQGDEFKREILETASFVPMLAGATV